MKMPVNAVWEGHLIDLPLGALSDADLERWKGPLLVHKGYNGSPSQQDLMGGYLVHTINLVPRSANEGLTLFATEGRTRRGILIYFPDDQFEVFVHNDTDVEF